MALAKDFMGLGMAPQLAASLGGQVKTGISSAGSAITDATDLTFSKNVVSTVTDGQGVQLTQMAVGESQIVYNASNTVLKVYPGASTTAINQLWVGGAAFLGPYTVCEFHQVSSTQVLANLSA